MAQSQTIGPACNLILASYKSIILQITVINCLVILSMAIEQKYGLTELDLLTPLGGGSRDGKVGNSLDVFESVDVLKGAMRNVSRRVIGRERLVSQTLLAILSREHQLIFSRTGTAKTLYARTVFGQFDAQTFFIQFTQGTTEEALVGAYDLNKFKEGTIWHKTERSIVTADFAFLDEFMDANDMVMRTLLGVLNEREFVKGEQYEQARLHTAIAATNFLRFTDTSEAVLDRMLFKARLNPETDRLGQLLIDDVYGKYNGRVVLPAQRVPMDIPRELAKIVKGENPQRSIAASNAILFLKNQLIRNYVDRVFEQRRSKDSRAERAYISPRTIAKARDVLNASALLHGRFEVTGEDLVTLRFLLTTVSGSGGDLSIEAEDHLFFQALDHTLASFTSEDLQTVENLLRINEFYDAYRDRQVVEFRKRVPILAPFTKVFELLGVTSWVEVSTETFQTALKSITINNPEVDRLRDDIVQKMEKDG